MTMICTNCSLRLFNKHYNLKGVGNPNSGNVIIIPNIDYNAYKHGSLAASEQVDIIKSVITESHISSTGGLLTNVFITPLLKCSDIPSSYPIDENVIKLCFNYIINDFKMYNFNNVLLCGAAANLMLNISALSKYTDKCFISSNLRKYVVTYNPLIKHIDEDKFKTFKVHLEKWYASCIYNDFSLYETFNMI